MSSFNTEQFKKLVAYAIQGVGYDKMYELSSNIGIKVSDETLYLRTTDGINFVQVSDSCTADDIDVTVKAELFAKLISKINSDTLEINVEDNTLVIIGNGTYTLELVPDETGEPLSYPDKFPTNDEELGTISSSDLVAIATSLEPSLSTVTGNVYTNYYFGDVVASTDKTMAATFNRKIFDDAYLFNRKFVNLMCIGMSDVTISKADKILVATANVSDTCSIKVCTFEENNIADFNIEGIKKFTSFEVNSFCKFRKADMLDLLDRISLFVSKFDDGAITLHFAEDHIEVSSLTSAGVESVEVTEFKDAKDCTFKINIDRFRNQLKAYSSDIVELYYGSDVCIKLIDGNVTQVIALMR